jgi:hypothetical protein
VSLGLPRSGNGAATLPLLRVCRSHVTPRDITAWQRRPCVCNGRPARRAVCLHIALSLQYTTSEVIHHCAIVAQKERNVFKNTIHGQRHGFVALAVLMLSTACADSTTLGPDLVGDAENRSGSVPTAGQLEGIVAGSSSNTGMRAPDLSHSADRSTEQDRVPCFRDGRPDLQLERSELDLRGPRGRSVRR